MESVAPEVEPVSVDQVVVAPAALVAEEVQSTVLDTAIAELRKESVLQALIAEELQATIDVETMIAEETSMSEAERALAGEELAACVAEFRALDEVPSAVEPAVALVVQDESIDDLAAHIQETSRILHSLASDLNSDQQSLLAKSLQPVVELSAALRAGTEAPPVGP